jgi:hypothetical protein
MIRKYLVHLVPAVFCAVFLTFQHAASVDIPEGQAAPGLDSPANVPTGQTEAEQAGREAIGAEVFGREGGYLHPFLFLDARYTDNLYYTNTGEVEDFILSAAPGLWLAVPGNREQLLKLQTANTAPGGLRVSRMKPAPIRRMQTYLMYSPELVKFTEESENDHVAHRAEGLFQYNLDLGLSLDLMDQFKNRYEINNNATGNLDEYYDNLASFIATYTPSDKFKLRLDYSNYWLDYDDSANDFRDRSDNSIAAYIFYRAKPKTSVFVEYEFADIRYDKAAALDSQEDRYYAGIDWEVTAKSRGRAKVGYIEKAFDERSFGDQDGFSVEVQAQHNFTPKQAASLNVYRSYRESSIPAAYTSLTTGIDLSLLQRFNPKWSGALNALFYRDEFEGELTVAGKRRERQDDTLRIGPALIFEPRDWGKFELGYYFSYRDSNFDIYDFENSTVYFSVELAL